MSAIKENDETYDLEQSRRLQKLGIQGDEEEGTVPPTPRISKDSLESVAGVQELDPGHVYKLPSYDGGSPQTLVFMKREGKGYPFNVGHHPGTNNQSLYRAAIKRHQYLQTQEACDENVIIIRKLRECIWHLEIRAAQRHGRVLPDLPVDIENVPTCRGCGHIGCKGNHRTQVTESAVSAALLADPPASSVQHETKSESEDRESRNSQDYRIDRERRSSITEDQDQV